MSTLPSPAVAAVLSFLFPGLGQAYAGARRRGLLLALPWVVLLTSIVLLATAGTDLLIELAFQPQLRLAVLVLLVGIFFYHLAAMLDAYAVAGRERQLSGAAIPPSSKALVAVLVVLMIIPYGVLEVYGIQASVGMADIFRQGDDRAFIPDFEDFDDEPTPAPGTLSPSPTPAPATPEATPDQPDEPQTPAAMPETPEPGPVTPPPVPADFGPIDAPWAENGRLDLLLVGSDSGPGRTSVRTDTMILLSVDIETGQAAMFGFPRNMINVPLPRESAGAYPGGIFPEMLSGLWRRAAERPGDFAGSEGIGRECQHQLDCERGWRALSGVIQNMAGVPIDGISAVDLQGFARLVDAVGGIWMNVPTRVVDERYPTEDGERIAIDIRPGCQRLDGTLALAYARSRRQDSDYQRMRRQQFVLQAIRRQFDPLALLPRVSELLDIGRDNLFTTIREEDIPKMAQVAQRVDADRMHHIRFQRQSLRNVTQEAVREMRRRVRNIFEEPPPDPTPTPRRAAERCPPR